MNFVNVQETTLDHFVNIEPSDHAVVHQVILMQANVVVGPDLGHIVKWKRILEQSARKTRVKMVGFVLVREEYVFVHLNFMGHPVNSNHLGNVVKMRTAVLHILIGEHVINLQGNVCVHLAVMEYVVKYLEAWDFHVLIHLSARTVEFALKVIVSAILIGLVVFVNIQTPRDIVVLLQRLEDMINANLVMLQDLAISTLGNVFVQYHILDWALR